MPDLLSGKKIGGLAMSETEAGSDVMSMRTTAIKKGDYYVINGNESLLITSVYMLFRLIAYEYLFFEKI